jgi:hypothetical protein
MPRKQNNYEFFTELKRRNVFRVAIAYLAGEREQGLMLIAKAADGGFFILPPAPTILTRMSGNPPNWSDQQPSD